MAATPDALLRQVVQRPPSMVALTESVWETTLLMWLYHVILKTEIQLGWRTSV